MSNCLCFLSRQVLSPRYNLFRVHPTVIFFNRGYARRQRIQLNSLEIPTEKQELTLLDLDNNSECFDDYFNSPNNKLQSKFDIQRIIEKEKEKLKLKILQRKFFKTPHEVNFLTWKTKEQIRFLNVEYPEEWTPQRLSQSFPISKAGVLKLLNSSYVIKSPEKILKHDSKVKERWKKLKEELSLNEGPVSPEFKHLIESGKLELLKNAGGLMEAPKMPSEVVNISKKNSEKRVGRFESILQNYKRLSEKPKYICDTIYEQASVKLMPSDQNTSLKIPKEESGQSEIDWSSINYNIKEIDVKPRSSGLEPSANIAAQISEERTKNVPRKIQKEIKSGHISISDLTYLEAYQLIGTKKVKNTNTTSQTENTYKAKENSENNSVSLLDELLPKSTYSATPVTDSPDRRSNFSAFTVEDSISIPEQAKQAKGTLYKKNNAYYDENGEFLYRVPISE